MMTTRFIHKQRGFTIVELMVATLVFAVILTVITSGVIHFTADYYKGVHVSATQTTARNLMSIIAQNLQYGGGSNSRSHDDITSENRYECLGQTLIDFKLGAKLSGAAGEYAAYVGKIPSPPGDCKRFTDSPAFLAGSKELLGPNMRLTNLHVAPNGASNGYNLYTISVGIAYGDDDLLCFTTGPIAQCSNTSPVTDLHAAGADWDANGNSVRCRSGKASQFCAVTHLTTQVVARFEN